MPWIRPPSDALDKQRLWDYFRDDIRALIDALIHFDFPLAAKYGRWVWEDFEDLWSNVESWSSSAVDALDRWVEGRVNHFQRWLENVNDWIDDLWGSLGTEIAAGWYTAVSWAEKMREEAKSHAEWLTHGIRMGWEEVWAWIDTKSIPVWDWISEKAGVVWDWIQAKSGVVWDWIQDQGTVVWDWVLGAGTAIEEWWQTQGEALDAWVSTYMEFYQDLFDYFRDDVLDFFDDPLGFLLGSVVLSIVSAWLYSKWFQRVE